MQRRIGRAFIPGLIVAAACTASSAQTGAPAPSSIRATPTNTPITDQTVPPVQLPPFQGSASVIDSATRARMGTSWRPGCPVAISRLRLLRMTFWGFDRQAHSGELIVNRAYATDVLSVFRTLYDARFPIQRMEIVHQYVGDVYTGRDDGPSDNDTAGFNCRSVLGAPGVWSEHAFGRAIDIDPIQNPYVSSTGQVLPKEGAPFANRARRRPGMIEPHGVVVRAFAAIGWKWGGDWHSFQDYMHFSSTGR